MQLQCTNCKADIPSEDININQLIAKCSQCNTVFEFEQTVRSSPRVRPEIVMPQGIEAYHLLSELNIEVKWKHSFSSFFAFFTIFWNAIVFIFVAAAILTGEYTMLLAVGVHLLIGIALLYYMLTVIVNTTYITVSNYSMLIEHKPLKLPFYPDRDIPVTEIEQLYVERYVASTTNNKPNYAFGLYLLKKNEEKIRLLKGLRNPEQARYVEQEVERFLKITDRKVEAEY